MSQIHSPIDVENCCRPFALLGPFARLLLRLLVLRSATLKRKAETPHISLLRHSRYLCYAAHVAERHSCCSRDALRRSICWTLFWKQEGLHQQQLQSNNIHGRNAYIEHLQADFIPSITILQLPARSLQCSEVSLLEHNLFPASISVQLLNQPTVIGARDDLSIDLRPL